MLAINLGQLLTTASVRVKDAQLAGQAFAQLKFLADSVNGPTWTPKTALDNDEFVYCVEFDVESGKLVVNDYGKSYDIAPNIYYKSEDLAEAAMKQYRDLYKALYFGEFVDDKKTLTYEAVERTALTLIDENGDTTTLEVKETLREQGYWATQAEVSEHMQEVMFNNRLNVASEQTDGKLHLKFFKRS